PAFRIRSLSDPMPGRPSRSTFWAEKACVPSEHRLFCTPAKQGSTSSGHRLHRNPEYKGLLRVRAVVPQQLPEPVVIGPTPGQIDGCRHRRPGLVLRILVHRHIELAALQGGGPLRRVVHADDGRRARIPAGGLQRLDDSQGHFIVVADDAVKVHALLQQGRHGLAGPLPAEAADLVICRGDGAEAVVQQALHGGAGAGICILLAGHPLEQQIADIRPVVRLPEILRQGVPLEGAAPGLV
ncbi:purine-nucleoside phosphorylase, partial [Dysosmobacter welbionis]